MSGANGAYTITLVPPLQGVTPGLPGRGTGPFAGMPVATLQAALLQAQNALIAAVTGVQPVTVEYAEGQGRRQVVYNRTNAEELRALVRDLRAALGMRPYGSIFPRFG